MFYFLLGVQSYRNLLFLRFLLSLNLKMFCLKVIWFLPELQAITEDTEDFISLEQRSRLC